MRIFRKKRLTRIDLIDDDFKIRWEKCTKNFKEAIEESIRIFNKLMIMKTYLVLDKGKEYEVTGRLVKCTGGYEIDNGEDNDKNCTLAVIPDGVTIIEKGKKYCDYADGWYKCAQTKRIVFNFSDSGHTIRVHKHRKYLDVVIKLEDKFNISHENIKRLYMVIETYEEKGKLTSEEVRRQLGEFLPGIFGVMADTCGVSYHYAEILLKAGLIELSMYDLLNSYLKKMEK